MKSCRIITGNSALEYNGLVNGTDILSIVTEVKPLDGTIVNNVCYEFFHFKDREYTREIKPGVFLPTAEKALLDAIVWLPENYNEGQLIEALQSYQANDNDKSKLYEVSDYYKVPHEFVDYWWKEAEEESDMSMG